MRRIVLLVLVVSAVALAPLYADTGVGVIVGEPTGLSVLLANRIALAAAWSLDGYLHLHGDLWLLKAGLVPSLDWYLGAGAKARFVDDDVNVGARVPVGLQFYVLPRLELFGEIVPGVDVLPETGFDLDGGIGVRFHF